MTEPILGQIERFAPGFRERILATVATRSGRISRRTTPTTSGVTSPAVGMDLGQLFTRPSLRLFDPYATGNSRIFLCSASTPPGGGVHGMPGFHAARSAERQLR